MLENGDPLIHKKARNDSNLMLLPPTCPAHALPNPRQTTTCIESNHYNDPTLDEGQAIVVDDSNDAGEEESDGETIEGETTDEGDEAELGM